MCLTPYQVKDKEDPTNYMPVPCGKCPECLKRRATGWAFRISQSDRYAMSSQFLTLTYATKHLQFADNYKPTLVKKDLQLFMKRLRKENINRLKYFACGEYGTDTERPHYHMLLFNADIQTIQPAWQLGAVHYGQVEGGSIAYVLKYMMKPPKINFKAIVDGQSESRTPEFQLMSKGLGLPYLTSQMHSWHKAVLTERMYCNLEDNKKIAMPRYYKNKIYTEEERDQIAAVSYKRLQDALEQKNAEGVAKYGLDRYVEIQEEQILHAFQKFRQAAVKNRNVL